MKKSHNPANIFNDVGTDVTARVAKFRTVFFHKKKYAIAHSTQTRSYVYEAFNDKQEPIGFCVPK